jgi:hypothetical protein
MRSNPLLLLPLAGLLAAAPIPPQSGNSVSAASDEDEIVVTAVPRDPSELRKAVTGFVGRVSQAATQNQLSRRASTFCPKVLGLEDRYQGIVLGRVRDAAEAAGLTELPVNCTTDLLIIFTGDGDALMTALRSKKPEFFKAQEPPKQRELFGSARAVRWWYENRARDQNGALVASDPRQLNEGASVAELPTTQIYNASLISTPIRISLSGNVVVIDVNKAEGYPLDAIASYAAMVSFAQVSARDRTLGDAPTVLGMFARTGPRREALRELTVWDRAYLKALYKIPMNRNFETQRRRLSTAMRDAIIAP